MAEVRHRILIWPSDDADADAPKKLPEPPSSSSSPSAAISPSHGDAACVRNSKGAGAPQQVAVVGWTDETASSVTTVVAGFVPLLPLPSSSSSPSSSSCTLDAAAGTTNESKSNERRHAGGGDRTKGRSLRCRSEGETVVSSAIDLLVKRRSAREGGRPSDGSRGDSREEQRNNGGCCREFTATYRSLRVLAVVPYEEDDHPADDNDVVGSYAGGKNDGSDAQTKGGKRVAGDDDDDPCDDVRRDHQHQLILYDPTEARRWHLERFGQRHFARRNGRSRDRKFYPDGTWERTALRMGEAYAVLEELSFAMGNMHPHVSEEGENASDATSTGEGEAERTIPSKDERKQTFDGIMSQSLLLLHLNLGKQNYKAFDAFAHIPLFSVLQHLVHENAAAGKIIGTCKYTPRPHAPKGNNHSTHATSRFIAILLDSLLGLMIGCILIGYPLPIIRYLTELWKGFHDYLRNEGLEWLESFPAGFKLNVELTQKIGKVVRSVILYQQKIASLLFPAGSSVDAAAATTTDASDAINAAIPTKLLRCLGLSTAVLGSRFFFAIAFDIARLSLLHIHFLSSLFAACQRLELRTLASLWLLFRGKKRNVLRQRSDHLKYDHMQLLVGIIMFTICLFLFTTILVYHCFFAIMDYLAELCVCGLSWCGFMVVEGVMQCDLIVMEEKMCQSDAETSWMGREMQFHPVILSEKSHFGGLLGEFERGSLECTKNLPPHTSISSNVMSTTKAVFPFKSGSSIIVNAICSFLVSRIGRVVTFCCRLMFGSPCPVASSFVEISRSTREHMENGYSLNENAGKERTLC